MKNILYTAICACSILCGAQAQTPGSEVPNLKKLYELTDSCDVNVRARFSPLIGISASISSGASRVGATYIQSIVKAGGTPIIIPAVTDGKVLRNIVSNLDGLVLIGGADVNPLWYEEEPREKLEEVDPVRDLYELKLIKMATDQNIPVLGICRGLQLLNVAFGGTLYQDIPSQRGDHSVKHRQDLPSSYGSHRVFVDANSQLASILGKYLSRKLSSSSSDQGVGAYLQGYRLCARQYYRGYRRLSESIHHGSSMASGSVDLRRRHYDVKDIPPSDRKGRDFPPSQRDAQAFPFRRYTYRYSFLVQTCRIQHRGPGT